MPLSLKKLTSNTVAKSIDFGDGDMLNVTYYPARLTGRMMAQIVNADPGSLTPAAAVALVSSPTDILTSLLASWDLVDEDDAGAQTPVPLTHDRIEALGIDVQWGILNGLLGNRDQDADDADAKSSAPMVAVGAAGSTPALPSGATS